MSTTTAWAAFIIMAISIVGKIVTQYFSQLQRTHAGYFMVADKRIHIGEKLKSVPMGYFNQNSLGQITAIETTILNDVENAVPVVLVTTLGGFLNSLVFALVMLVFDWRMGAVTLLGIVIFLIITAAMEKKSREGVPARQEAQTILVEAVLETIQGMSVVKAFDLDNNLDKKVDRAIEESFKRNEKLEKAMTPYVAIYDLGCRVSTVFQNPRSQFFCVDVRSELAFGAENLKFDKAEILKRIENTSQELNLFIDGLEIPKASVIAIIGRNGAGKSTFVRCLCGLEKKTKGLLEDGTVKHKAKNRLEHSFLVMQDVNRQLFTESVEEEIILSMKEKDEPTSGLDYFHMQQVADCIKNLQEKGKSIFLITHDIELIYSCCNYVLQVENGTVKDMYQMNEKNESRLRSFFSV